MYAENSKLSYNNDEEPKSFVAFVAIVIVFILLLVIIVKINNKLKANVNETRMEHYQDSVLNMDTVNL